MTFKITFAKKCCDEAKLDFGKHFLRFISETGSLYRILKNLLFFPMYKFNRNYI